MSPAQQGNSTGGGPTALRIQLGSELRRLPSPDNEMIYAPAWSEDGRRVAMITQGTHGRALRLADLETGAFQTLAGPGLEDVGNPVLYRDTVLYQSSFDGVNNIYAMEIAGGRRYRVTASKFGASDPAVSPDGTSRAAAPSVSRVTARSVATTETPQANASTGGIPKPS